MNAKPIINRRSGFVILFAVILVSIVLTISLSLFNITFRQLVLSTLARDTQLALFAADSGRECAIHYDQYGDSGGVFPFGSYHVTYNPPQAPIYNLDNASLPNNLTCSNQSQTLSDFTGTDPSQGIVYNCGSGYYCRAFNVTFPGNNYCARVVVIKKSGNGLSANDRFTQIVSNGYSYYSGSGDCGISVTARTANQRLLTGYNY